MGSTAGLKLKAPLMPRTLLACSVDAGLLRQDTSKLSLRSSHGTRALKISPVRSPADFPKTADSSTTKRPYTSDAFRSGPPDRAYRGYDPPVICAMAKPTI